MKKILVAIMILVLSLSLFSCSSRQKCKVCHGSGYYQNKTCVFCNGTGYSDYDPYDHYSYN